MTENDGLVRFGPASMTMELYQDTPKHKREQALVDVFLSRTAKTDIPEQIAAQQREN